MKLKAGQYAEKYKIIGLDRGLLPVFKTIYSVARYNINILLIGETGTGKELFADFIHQISEQKYGPIIKINCASLPDNLLESELFGYEKGAFTGAYQSKKGKIELADNGTLFLDEIGEIKLELQAKLLRVLQTKEVSRIGSMKTRKINFRLIAATNLDLNKAVQGDRFRADLYYRLSTFPIQIPPLRERGEEDLDCMIKYLLDKICLSTNLKKRRIPAETSDLLKKYNWPGNVRELENVLFQALVYSQEQDEISTTIITRLIKKNKQQNYHRAVKEIMQTMIQEKLDLKDINKKIIHFLLEYYDNNVNLIQQQTGLSKDRIYRYRRENDRG